MKAIYGFTSQQEWDDVNDKIYEYEGYKHNYIFSGPSPALLINGSISWSVDIETVSSEYTKILAYDYLHPVKYGDRVEVRDGSGSNGDIFEVVSDQDEDGDFKLRNDTTCIWRHEDVLQVIKEDPTEEFKVGDKVEIVGGADEYIGETSIVLEVDSSIKITLSDGTPSYYNREYLKLIHDTGLDSDEAYESQSLTGIDTVDAISYTTASIGSDQISRSDVEEMIENALQLVSEEDTETILNTNNKTMNTIQQEAKTIATEDYFMDKKVIKKVRQADAEMQDLLEILENALEQIEQKRSRLNGIAHNFNSNYSKKNMDSIKGMLDNHEEVIEFMDTFITQSVSDFTEETTKERFDVEEVFSK